MWKYDGERLENKNGDWIYLQETWKFLPSEDKDIYSLSEDEQKKGEAIVNSDGKILKLDSNNKGMHLKLR